MASYLNKIRPESKDQRIRGLMVGFCTRLEQELAKAAAEPRLARRNARAAVVVPGERGEAFA